MARTLTVIMPVYNAMPFVEEAVGSLLQQTYRDFRLLAVDDGSTDGSAEFLDSLTDPRVEVRHQRNVGEYETANAAVASVDSELIAFLHADDIAARNRLREQVEFLTSHREVACVLSNYTRFSGKKVFGTYWTNNDEKVSRYDSRTFGAITPTTMCIRRIVWQELGGFRAVSKSAGDYDFLLRCEERHRIAVINEALVKYRIHGNTKTNKGFFEQQLDCRYFLVMAALRRTGHSEITLHEFRENERRAPALLRFKRAKETLGKLQFRRAGMALGEGRYLNAAFNLACACVMKPEFALGRLLALYRSRAMAKAERLGVEPPPVIVRGRPSKATYELAADSAG